MPIEEVTAYEFSYTPWDENYPVRCCRILIYARTRREAELIALQNYKFFDQDATCSVKEVGIGYRRAELVNA